LLKNLNNLNTVGASSKALFNALVDGIGLIYSSNEAKSIVYILLEHFQNLSKLDIINDELLVKSIDFSPLLNRLLNHEPVQYIIGETYFYENYFKVNKHTLIPRPETEELVDWAIKHLKKTNSKESAEVLDIGTGSGCIAISVAKAIENVNVTAFDVSENALKTSFENARHLKAKVDFQHYDILENKNAIYSKKFDLILSNPPYVLNSEKAGMKANVLAHEPDLALFVENENPLLFYKAIALFTAQNLNEKGKVMVEINEQFGIQTEACFREVGFSKTEIIKDINNKDRFVFAER
jgi:release factor glutamine methyltransferase